MPKRIEDIVVPERRRSIRDIPVPEGRQRDERPVVPFIPRGSRPLVPLPHDFNFPDEERKVLPYARKGVWVTAGLVLAGLIFFLFSLFNGATLAYTPKSAILSFDNDIQIARKSGEGTLLYSILKFSKDGGREVPASGEGEIQRKASGTIIIYNTGARKQRLRATTRFRTPDGKIYQIQDGITVPPKRTLGGTEEPGTLEVKVYAELPGKEFNITLTDFTLPGLEGTSLFSSIYARSKTAMSGGFSGVERIVSSQDKTRVKAELEIALRDELISEARAQVPADFILFPSLSSVIFEELSQTDSGLENSVMVNIRGNLYGIIFKKSDLSNSLAFKKVKLSANQSVDITTFDRLVFAFAGVPPVDLLLSDEIKFSVTGEGRAVWRVDEQALKADLIGRRKKDLPSVLSNYPTIISATATIWPFWKNVFPADSVRISLKQFPVE